MTAERIRILVVEDNPGDADLVDERLREAKGYRFDIAHEEHLAGAVHRLATEPFDVILLDLGLADSQGFDTLRRMQQACGQIPIVVLTGLNDQEAGLEAVRKGAQDFLVKSEVTASLLIRSVRYAIERQHTDEAGRLLAAIVESSDEAIIGKSLDMTITSWNKGAERLYGYSAREAIGKCVCLIVPEERRDELKQFAKVIRGGGRVAPHDTTRQRKDGSQVDVSVSLSPVCDRNGKIVAISSVARDISERLRLERNERELVARLKEQRLAALNLADDAQEGRERAERAEKEARRLAAELEHRVKERTVELEAANKELEAFAYSVSHDLRSPLRAIDGFSQILLKEYVQTLPEKPQHYLQMVCDNARQMGRLIDDLLRFSRTGRQSVQLLSVSPQQLVEQCLEELRPEREGRRIEIQIKDLPGCWGDSDLLKQVWLNLLGNALKYTRGRDPAKIEIGSFVRDDGGGARGETVYYVRDNGVGFDMQYASKLFGVFQRLHSAGEFEGTGIGLALVQRIIHRHGGRIWADAKVDQGATFCFTLGRRPAHDLS